jgi:hypothetical protein
VYEDQKHIQEQINGLPANARPEGCMRLSMTIVPTLRVVTQRWTLRVTWTTRMQALGNDAQRRGMHAHAERGHDQYRADAAL